MYKKFSFKVFLFVAIIFGSVGGINFLVDPYGLYRTVEKNGINQQKEGVRNKIRYIQSLQVIMQSPKTIMIGSSRVHDGLNPQSTSIPASFQPVYNYGMPMIRIKEIKLFLTHAVKRKHVENVIIGLDFFMFNAKEKLNREFDPSLIDPNMYLLNLYFKPLFSTTALSDSIQTIKISHQQKMRNEFLENGYRPGSQVNFGLKSYERLHNYTNWTFLSTNQTDTLYYQDFAIDDEVFRDLREIFQLCKNNHLNLYLYISPAHATLDGEGIIASGNLHRFEIWKKNTTSIANDFNITLWDFSGYNSITTEKVKTPMKYYWDSSHFTERVGDLILAKVLLNTIVAPSDFGIKLTPKNIDQHLKSTQLRRRQYYELHRIEMDTLHKLYHNALSGKRQDPTDIEGIF
ncbi:MAG: hypothetical protein Q8S36_09015 [Sulfuricurvum sp.]|nr:hypothetical protein [Sulfuricurvum sp.]